MILSVDPGERCGWCRICADGHTVARRFSIVDGDDTDAIYGIIDMGRKLTVLVIESQYAKRYTRKDGKSGINFRSVETLMLRAHRWIVLAELYGIEVVQVKPSVWQKYFHIKPGDKKAIIALASNIAGQPVESDAADALLIGEWYRLRGIDS